MMKSHFPITHDPSRPLVSVLVHNHNGAAHLWQCMESVAAQSYDNIEMIFSDNGSEDGSWDIAERFSVEHPGLVTLMRNRCDRGDDANFKNVMLNIRGKYYVNMSSFNVMDPQYVS